MRAFIAVSLIFLSASVNSFAQLRVPSVLSSGMVLQQNDSVSFWGWGWNGQQVKITGSWDNSTTTGTVSNLGKWNFKVKTPSAGGPFTVRINSAGEEITLSDVMIGEVWVCSGQSNMEWSYYNGARFIREEFPDCYNKNIRFFQVPRLASDYPQDDLRAAWRVCDSNSLKGFSAVGYFFGKKLNHDLNVPIGLINSSWGGTPAETWTPSANIYSDEILKKSAAQLQEVPWGPIKPGLLYNGMIAPLTRFAIAGAIWYQGEANVGTNSTYSKLLTTMIDSWRNSWNKEFPFYYVQIAPYKYGNEYEGALLQEQQTKTMAHTKTGMVVITDLIDSVTNIHPSDKRMVGARLANWALAEAYGRNVGEYKSPSFSRIEVNKDKLVISFDHASDGLMAKDKIISGFYISGANEEWLPADAKIDNGKIIVWNKNLKQPVYVRYGFSNTIVGNVFSKSGLPLTPFRTDDWPSEQSRAKN